MEYRAAQAKEKIPLIKEQVSSDTSAQAELQILELFNPKTCPHCKTETMITLEILPKRGPPEHAKLIERVRQNLKK